MRAALLFLVLAPACQAALAGPPDIILTAGGARSIASYDVHPGGTEAALATGESLQIFSLTTGKIKRTLLLGEAVKHVRYSPGGSWAAVQVGPDTRIYDLPRWTFASVIFGFEKPEFDGTNRYIYAKGQTAPIRRMSDLSPLVLTKGGTAVDYAPLEVAGLEVFLNSPGLGAKRVIELEGDWKWESGAPWPTEALGPSLAASHRSGMVLTQNSPDGWARIHTFVNTEPFTYGPYLDMGGSVWHPRFSRDGAFLVHGTYLVGQPPVREARLWSVDPSVPTVSSLGAYTGAQGSAFSGVVYNPPGAPLADVRALIGAEGSGDLHWINAATLQKIHDLTPTLETRPVFASSPDGRLLASAAQAGSFDKGVQIWESPTVDSLNPTAVLPAVFPVASIAFSPDGTRLAVGGGQGTEASPSRVEVWKGSGASWSLERTIFPACSPQRLEVTSRGVLLVQGLGGSYGLLQAFGLLDGSLLSQSGRWQDQGGFRASPDGTMVFAGRRILRLPDVSSVVCEAPMPDTGGAAEHHWTPDGAKVVFIGTTDAGSQTVCVWNAAVRGGLVSIAQPRGAISGLDVSPDGRSVALLGRYAKWASIVSLVSRSEAAFYDDEVWGRESGGVQYTPDGSRLLYSRLDGPLVVARSPLTSICGRLQLPRTYSFPSARGVVAVMRMYRPDGSLRGPWGVWVDRQGGFSIPLNEEWKEGAYRLNISIPGRASRSFSFTGLTAMRISGSI